MAHPSVMTHSFSSVPTVQAERSVFDRSFGLKTAFYGGKLYPIFVDEIYPGDSIKLSANVFARLTTPIVPFLDNLFVDTFWFYVPNRLLWDNWKAFMGEQEPYPQGPIIDYVIPHITMTVPGGTYHGALIESIFDYMGIPVAVPGLNINALPLRAYVRIWNEWFRDENLQGSQPLYTTDGPDQYTDYSILPRGKRHDYFTACLPWPQKGPGVSIPLGTSAPVFGNGYAMALTDGTHINGMTSPDTYRLGSASTAFLAGIGVGSANSTPFTNNVAIGLATQSQFNANSLSSAYTGLIADLSTAAAATINSLRLAFQIQRLQERDARGGTRYVELIKAHWGVTNPDFRLQRSEYLGGGSDRMNINPVQQTSETAGTPLGHLAAYGVGTHKSGFSKSFTEHGYIIGLINVRADITYQRGLERLWSRLTKYDFYWPALAHIGEQAVLYKEIFAQGPSVQWGNSGKPYDEQVWGYQEAWADLRYKPSKITGKLRSTWDGLAQADTWTSLDVWHLSQKWDDVPVLGDEFIQDNPPLDRVLAVSGDGEGVDEPQIKADIYYNYRHARALPTYSVPGLIDHF